MSQTSLDKDKIKFLLLEGVHPNAVQVLNQAGYTNVEQFSGALEGDTTYLEPDETTKEAWLKIQSLMTVDPETAVNEVLPEIADWAAEQCWLIIPITNVQQCVVINSDIGNVPTGGVGISWNFSMEQFFYNHPEEH